jgi:diacylglycerol kinase family enzyme
MDARLALAIVSTVISALVLILLVVVLVSLRGQKKSVAQLMREQGERWESVGPGGGLFRRPGTAGASAQKQADESTDATPVGTRRIAVVMNPSKQDDPERFRERVRTAARKLGERAPDFYDTSVEDPGFGQAQQAVADGAELVIAAGGDGTVRMVAAALAHSGVRMAILPVGTGNLMARNLQLPLGNIEKALRIALGEEERAGDMAWLRMGMSTQEVAEVEPLPYLVIAGVGADAEIMSITDPVLKKHIGWWAYVVAGFQRVFGHPYDAEVQMIPGRTQQLKARTVLIGNVGKLTAGFVLMPNANAFNQRLEVLILDWLGAAGLGQIGTQLLNPRAKPIARISTLQRGMVKEIRVITAKPQPVELDGDAVGRATHVVAKVDPGSLRLQVPADMD